MQNQKIKNIAFCICLIFILHPLLCLPLIIIEVYNKRHYALILLGCFMGLCAMLWPPTGDLYRHTMDYFDYIVLTVAAVVSYWQGLGIKFSRISN